MYFMKCYDGRTICCTSDILAHFKHICIYRKSESKFVFNDINLPGTMGLLYIHLYVMKIVYDESVYWILRSRENKQNSTIRCKLWITMSILSGMCFSPHLFLLIPFSIFLPIASYNLSQKIKNKSTRKSIDRSSSQAFM